MTPVFTGSVAERKLRLDHAEQFKGYLLSLEGKRVVLTVEKQTRKRTNNQNAYYWGVLVKLISDETGMDSEEVHDFLKHKFLRRPSALSRSDPGVLAKSDPPLQ